MFKCIRNNTPCLPLRWFDFIVDHSIMVVVASALITSGVLAYTAFNFRLNSDFEDMISRDLPFRRTFQEYRNAFPTASDNITIVVEADTPEQAYEVRRRLAALLRKEPEICKSVYLPGGDSFFERNGLLYLSVEELETLSDNLADAQPLIAALSRDMSARGLFSIIEKVLKFSGDAIGENSRLLLLLDRIGDAFAHALKGEAYELSWQEIVLDDKAGRRPHREFIIINPYMDYTTLYPGKVALDMVSGMVDEIRQEHGQGVRVNVTGSIALQHEDLMTVRRGAEITFLTALGLVLVVLYAGLRSFRLVIISSVTLIMGLILTMGFGLALLGSLNLISVTFAVLFIGIGIDYSIQLCMRYREAKGSGLGHRTALVKSCRGVGNALILCTVTTAMGFFAFVPTAYKGASELGVVTGFGMVICLAVNLTVLPALLHLLPPGGGALKPFLDFRGLSGVPEKYPKATAGVAGGLVLLSLAALPMTYFDFNVLNLANPEGEAVSTAKKLFEDGRTSPWSISVLEKDLDSAKELSAKLRGLDVVDAAISAADFVPERQGEKLEIINDIALFMLPLPEASDGPPPDHERTMEALDGLEAEIEDAALSGKTADSSSAAVIERLTEATGRLRALAGDHEKGRAAFGLIERGLLPNLSIMLERLEASLEPEAFGLSDLPRQLKRLFVSPEGRYRVQVFPREDITDMDANKRFVADVRTLAPDATGAPVTILESGHAIISAFRQAALTALGLIAVFLLLVLGTLSETVLILVPLMAAVLFTTAASTLLGIPFNYTNVIVIPLLLGLGIDYSIHLVYRYREETAEVEKLLRTSTAHAVFVSAITTIASFGALSFSLHRGTASMGRLLTICIFFMIASSLIVLPAFLSLYRTGRRPGPAPHEKN
jgi:hopanoid biosynthesis associated RND transporter like protein HpnN